MKRKIVKRFLVALAIGAFVLAVQPSEAGSMKGHEYSEEKRAMWEEKKKKMYEKIGVSEEQQAMLEANRYAHREAKKKIYEMIKVKRNELRQQLQAPEVDLPAIQAIHSEIKELKMQKEDLRLQKILNVRSILTHEQFAELMKWKDSFKGQRGSHKGSHKGSYKMTPEEEKK